VRLLESGDTSKNDPNDALSVAVAALRSKARQEVRAEDHAAVLKMWARRHRDLARARNQIAWRCMRWCASWFLAASGRKSPQRTLPVSSIRSRCLAPLPRPRRELAEGFLQDLRRLDAQLRDTKRS
jgi:transposase